MFKLLSKNGKKHHNMFKSGSEALQEKLTDGMKFAEHQSDEIKKYYEKNKDLLDVKKQVREHPTESILASIGMILLIFGTIALIGSKYK